MYNGWFYFLSSAVQLVSSEVAVTANQTTLLPGERSRITITLPKGENEKPPELNDSLNNSQMESSGVKILAREERDLGTSYQWQMDVTAYLPGVHFFPALSVTQGPRTYSTERVELTVASTRPADDEALRPSYGAITLPTDWLRLGKILALFTLIGYLLHRLWCFYRYAQSRPPKGEAPDLSPPNISPKDWLVQELKRQTEAINDDHCHFFLQAVHEYFFRIGEMRTASSTARELSGRSNSQIKTLLPLLKRCDVFRYQTNKEAEPELVQDCIHQTLQLLCTA